MMSPSDRGNTKMTLAPTPRRRDQSPYWPLDSAKDEIRLMTILPPSSIEEDVICCTLSQMPLCEAPPYEALSYTWADENGDSSLNATISIEGRPFQVTKNLEAALRQLRLPRSKRVFWIDAICIDQKNDPERSHQVGMMRTIYEKASEVAIWLGSENYHSNLIFLFLHGVSECDDAVERTQRTLLNPSILETLALVFMREYWNRIWIVQEVISAREKTIYCGSDSISWNAFRKALNFITNSYEHLGAHRSTDLFLWNLISTAGPQQIERYWNLYTQGLPDLLTVLRMFRTSVSSDPRDKVYGIVGLTTARDDPIFTVDYSLTIREVYVNVVKYIVSTSHNLDVITSKNAPVQPDWLPSWVPDWSYVEAPDSLHSRDSFNAALNEPADALFESSGRVLRVQGIITGTIKFAAIQVDNARHRWFSHEKRRVTRGYKSHDFYFFLFSFCDWYTLAMTHANYETISESVFHQTMCSGKFPEEIETPEVYLEALTVAITHYMPDYPMDGLLGDAFIRMQKNMEHQNVRDVLEANNGLYSWTAEKMSGKRLFVCSEGRMGVAPYRAEIGDLVCVLFGSSRPVILRPQDGHYIVIGNAYVQGMMYGEAIEGLSSGKYKKQEFELH